MNTSSQISINATQQFSENNEVENDSGKVALTMGAFSIVLLGIVSSILSILHSVFY